MGRGILARLGDVLAFLCLLGICYQAHELGHHFFGGWVCGELGSVDFSHYTSPERCGRTASLATELFGPLVSLAIAYGAALRLGIRSSRFSLALIFASYFHLRWIPPLLGAGDELDVARKLGFDQPAVVAAVVFALGLYPVAAAWRARALPRWTVPCLYLLPLPFLWYVDAISARISGPQALFPALSDTLVAHVPLSVVLVDVLLVLGFFLFGTTIVPARAQRHRPAGR